MNASTRHTHTVLLHVQLQKKTTRAKEPAKNCTNVTGAKVKVQLAKMAEGTDSMMFTAPKRSKQSYVVCNHCNKELRLKKYKEHRRLYFDDETQSWAKDSDQDSVSSEFSSLDEFEVGSVQEDSVVCSSQNDLSGDSNDGFEDPLCNSEHETSVQDQGNQC